MHQPIAGKAGGIFARQLEICAETLQACSAAEVGGADRIELCVALGEGGVSPSRGLLKEALDIVSVPVHVLIRPRTGDFVYTAAEFRALLKDVDDALTAGSAGIVVGILTSGYEIDRLRLHELIRMSGSCPVTFHRAFDQVEDLARSLEMLIDLGCERVLSSGGTPSVDQGLGRLSKLVNQADGRIRIAAGGGVTVENAARIASVDGLDLHASLRARSTSPATAADPLWGVAGGTISVDAVRLLGRIVHGSASLCLEDSALR
jgi:copper homeostasis protein